MKAVGTFLHAAFGCSQNGLSIPPPLCDTLVMANKCTKADKAQRQADQLEKKLDRRPEQVVGKGKARKDVSQAA
jgi:hypothetical protein